MLDFATENADDTVETYLKNIKLISFEQALENDFNDEPSWKLLAVQGLLAFGVPINTIDKNGATLLMWASENGLTEVVEHLLGEGADPELADHQGQTALIKAAINGKCPAIVAQLIEKKVNTEKVDHLGKSALAYAVSIEFNYSIDTIAMSLIKHQRKLKGTRNQQTKADRFAAEFVLTFENSRLGVIDYMLKHKPSLLMPHEDFLYKIVAKKDKYLTGVLLQRASLELREKLFAYRDNEGKTALELALQSGYLPCVRRLLACGDDILKLNNIASQNLLRAHLGNKNWQNLLKGHVDGVPEECPTLTLTELAAEMVAQQAKLHKTPLNTLALPAELVSLCQKAPEQLMFRTHNKIRQQKKAFVENQFAAYEMEKRGNPARKRRMKA